MYIIDQNSGELGRWVRDEIEFPGEIKKGKRGAAARRVQEWLTLHGLGVVIDGDFGRVSEGTLQLFQFNHGLTETGIVDEETWAALVQPMVDTLVNPLIASVPLGDGVVEFASQHLIAHPREVGGANAGPWVRLYMKGFDGPSALWCAGFVTFCLNQAAEALMHPMPIGGSFSCDTLAHQGQQAGSFLSERHATPDRITPGSIFLKRSDPFDWTHTGLVTSAGDTLYQTIEGNTNDDGSREGYEVCARRRGYSKTDFIIL